MNNTLENNDRVEIYLDAVSGFITNIDPDDLAALRRELRDHLLALVAQYRPGCVFEEDAVEAALRKFGPAYRVGPALDRMTPAGRARRLEKRYYVKRRWKRVAIKSALVLVYFLLPLFLHNELFAAAFVFAPVYGIVLSLSEDFDDEKPPVVVNSKFWRLFGLTTGFLCTAWLLEVRFASPMLKHWMTPLLGAMLLLSFGKDLTTVWLFTSYSQRRRTVR